MFVNSLLLLLRSSSFGEYPSPRVLESCSSYHLNRGALNEYADVYTFRIPHDVKVVVFSLLCTMSLK